MVHLALNWGLKENYRMAAKLHYVKMYYDEHSGEGSMDSGNKVLCSH
jgi:hypothetical protein